MYNSLHTYIACYYIFSLGYPDLQKKEGRERKKCVVNTIFKIEFKPIWEQLWQSKCDSKLFHYSHDELGHTMMGYSCVLAYTNFPGL